MSHHQASHDDNQLCDPDELAGLNYGTAKLQISTPSPHSPEKAILDPPRNISINGCISNSSNGMDCSIPYSLAPRSASNSDRGRPLTRRSVELYQKPPAYLGQGLEGEESPTEKLGKDYFAMRNGACDSAVRRGKLLLNEEEDGEFKGAWLLTQIDHWDHEKERLILLSSHSILILNHNFISLETSWISRIPIEKLEKVIIGPLVYPEKSIVPHVNTVVEGAANSVRSLSPARRLGSQGTDSGPASPGPRGKRFNRGVRLMWDLGKQLGVLDKWNPWSKQIPFMTFQSHPLHWIKLDAAFYEVENFGTKLSQVVQQHRALNMSLDGSACSIVQEPILIEAYVGLSSVIHNANQLGFYKCRGVVSF